MARMGFLDKAEELDVMIEAERARLKKVPVSTKLDRSFLFLPSGFVETHQREKSYLSTKHVCIGSS